MMLYIACIQETEIINRKRNVLNRNESNRHWIPPLHQGVRAVVTQVTPSSGYPHTTLHHLSDDDFPEHLTDLSGLRFATDNERCREERHLRHRKLSAANRGVLIDTKPQLRARLDTGNHASTARSAIWFIPQPPQAIGEVVTVQRAAYPGIDGPGLVTIE